MHVLHTVALVIQGTVNFFVEMPQKKNQGISPEQKINVGYPMPGLIAKQTKLSEVCDPVFFQLRQHRLSVFKVVVRGGTGGGSG